MKYSISCHVVNKYQLSHMNEDLHISTCSPDNKLRFFVTTSPAVLKTRSGGVLDPFQPICGTALAVTNLG